MAETQFTLQRKAGIIIGRSTFRRQIAGAVADLCLLQVRWRRHAAWCPLSNLDSCPAALYQSTSRHAVARPHAAALTIPHPFHRPTHFTPFVSASHRVRYHPVFLHCSSSTHGCSQRSQYERDVVGPRTGPRSRRRSCSRSEYDRSFRRHE